MITEYGFDITLHYKCNLFGKAFVLASRDGYNVDKFVKEVMTSKELDWLFAIDDCQEWCDEYFFYAILRENVKCKKQTHFVPEDDFFMWFAGYLYKYWMNTRGTPRSLIYGILPLQKLRDNFGFYHTQDWDRVIDDCLKFSK